jgi:hypothetical protein
MTTADGMLNSPSEAGYEGSVGRRDPHLIGPNRNVPNKGDLVGTWKLVSAWSTNSNGEQVPFYGRHPIGFLTYTKEGRMIAIVSDSNRPALSSEDDLSVPVAERAAAFSSFIAYAGTFRIEGDSVIHHVEISSLQNWVGSDQVRRMKLEGNRLTLWPPSSMLGGEQRGFELVWERMK